MSEEHKISSGTAFMMIVTALIIDGLQAVLDLLIIGFLLNPFIDIGTAIIFGIWFSHHGISMLSGKNILPFFGTIIAEFIPGINALPLWTFDIIFTISTSRVVEVIEPPSQDRGPWRL